MNELNRSCNNFAANAVPYPRLPSLQIECYCPQSNDSDVYILTDIGVHLTSERHITLSGWYVPKLDEIKPT